MKSLLERVEERAAQEEGIESLWTIFEVAHYLDSTPGAVYELIERYGFPHFKCNGVLRFHPRTASP